MANHYFNGRVSGFESLSFETLIINNQNEYYKALALSDSQGSSTAFIDYMLNIVGKSLSNLLEYNNRALKRFRPA